MYRHVTMVPYTVYKNIGQAKKFEDSPDFHLYRKEEKWLEKIKSKRTGEYYQAEELIRRELVPPDWRPPHVDAEGRPKTYPLKQVNCIIRIRAYFFSPSIFLLLLQSSFQRV